MEPIIRQWYDDANSLLMYLMQLRHTGCQPILKSVIVYESSTPEDVQRAEQVLREKHYRIADELVNAGQKINTELLSLNCRLREHLSDRIELLELPLFEIGGLPAGNSVWPALEGLAVKMEQWAFGAAARWDGGLSTINRHVNLERLAVDPEGSCPLDNEILNKFRERMRLEKLRLIKDLKDYPPTTNAAESTPTNLANAEANSLVTNQEAEENSEPAPPPKYDATSIDWILGSQLAKLIDLTTDRMSEYRKASVVSSSDDNGKWGVDAIGTYRRAVYQRHVAYYVPELKPTYLSKFTRNKKSTGGS